MNTKQVTGKFSIEDVLALFKNRKDPEGLIKAILIIVGIFLTPITLLGMVWFYARWYNRFGRKEGFMPVLWPLLPLTRVAMVIGGFIVWVIGYFAIKVLWSLYANGMNWYFMFVYLVTTVTLTFFIIRSFNQWRWKIMMNLKMDESEGTAIKATFYDYEDLYLTPRGLYLGDVNIKYPKQGHIITMAGPGSGKFTNLIAPNLLGAGNYLGSWFVIDVKGEIFMVTSKYQESIGQKVIVLNPWNLHKKSEATFNPLDLIDVSNPENLIDDTSVIAQMIVPEIVGDKDPYWRNRARSWVTGMITHLMLSKEEKTLYKIWEWLRLPEKEFETLIIDMAVSSNDVVKGCGNEIAALKANERGFSSIQSAAQDATDFLKSPALQASLKTSSFDLNELSNGKTTLYVVIPADKIDTQAQWLRLVTATSLLSVVRNKNKQVTFVLDEFANLGKMDIVTRYMGLSRGYNITLWLILQSLSQFHEIYGNGWETIMGSASVKHYFGVNDNFSAAYISTAFGNQTYFSQYYKESEGQKRNQRPLYTPDEVRRLSGGNIFLQVEQRSPYTFGKVEYYNDPELVERAEENPYSPVPLPNPKIMKRMIKLPKL